MRGRHWRLQGWLYQLPEQLEWRLLHSWRKLRRHRMHRLWNFNGYYNATYRHSHSWIFGEDDEFKQQRDDGRTTDRH